MKGIFSGIEDMFAFRRVFRFGRLSTKDLQEAFSISPKTAERRLDQSLNPTDPMLKGLLRKEGRMVVLAPNAMPPSFAGEKDLSEALMGLRGSGLRPLFFATTGLREAELKISRSEWLNNLPKADGIFSLILSALRNRNALEVSYVGLNRGESGETGTQRIVPLSVQVIGDQMSLYALRQEKYDPRSKKWIKENGECLRTFVFSRFLSAQLVRDKTGKPLAAHKNQLPFPEELVMRQPLLFNNSLTEDQKTVLAHELRFENGDVSLPESRMFQFLRLYADQPLAENGVWPPLRKGSSTSSPWPVDKK